jgi:hypothetical protein
VLHSQWEKIHQITIKCTKWPENIQNDRKIDQIATKIPTSSIAKNTPNWGFWFENIPSGNPGLHLQHAVEANNTSNINQT